MPSSKQPAGAEANRRAARRRTGMVAENRAPAMLNLAMRATSVVAHPWLCDAMGHLNSRHYLAFFDDANQVLLSALTGGARIASRGGSAWVDVRNELDCLKEVLAGAVLEVHLGIERVGRTSLTVIGELRSTQGARHALIRAVLVHISGHVKTARPLPPSVRKRASPWMIQPSECASSDI
jgi:acyl-CoA thioester hydrolase